MKVRSYRVKIFYTFDYIILKLTNSKYSLDNIDMGFDTTEEIVAEELEKQRRKLRDITATLDQQHQMLRLIVQVGFVLIYVLYDDLAYNCNAFNLIENGN